MSLNSDKKKKFIDRIEPSLKDGSFVKMTFGKYRGGGDGIRELTVTLINTTDGEKLSFRFVYASKDIVKNYDFSKALRLIEEITGKDFLAANLFTTAGDHSIDYSRKLVPTLHSRKPAFSSRPSLSHNREKTRMVDASAVYFNLLGLTSREGKVLSEKYDKFRQVDKFIQIVDSLIMSSELAGKNKVTALDLGSGKSYMTFALYDYLAGSRNLNPEVKGVEQRPDLAAACNSVAEKCGFAKLSFTSGEIKEQPAVGADIVTALHACDTATDDSIALALNCSASLILLAPCCQKYVRSKIKIPGQLRPVLKFGIHEERMAVMLTDSLRALVLQYFGYRTNIFEFISTEHTARNTMISALKTADRQKDEKALAELNSLKEFFGLQDFYLDRILGLC